MILLPLGTLGLLASFSHASIRPCREPIPRTTVCTPSPEESASVLGEIRSALAAKAALDDRARVEGENRRLANSGDYDRLQSWEVSNYELRRARSNADHRFEKAVESAARAFGIAPTEPGRFITEPPFEGVPLAWSPKAWLLEGTVYRTSDREGNSHYLPGFNVRHDEPSAVRSNGDILLNVGLFVEAAKSNDLKELALVLAFETARYDAIARGDSLKQIQRKGIEAEIAAARAFGAPQKRIDKLNDEWRNLVNDVFNRPLPELTDYFQHVRLSNVWQGELEAQRQRLQNNLNDQRARREEQQREAWRREQEEANIPREQRELARINAQYMAALAEAFCDYPALAEMRGQVIHEQWASVVQDSEPPPNPLDIDYMKFEGTCTQYVVNQALHAKKIGRDSRTPEWLNFAVQEGILRANGAAPLHERIRAATPPPPPPQTTPPSGGTWSPDPVVDEPTLNPIPHCRYHGWCKEPQRKQRDQ